MFFCIPSSQLVTCIRTLLTFLKEVLQSRLRSCYITDLYKEFTKNHQGEDLQLLNRHEQKTIKGFIKELENSKKYSV